MNRREILAGGGASLLSAIGHPLSRAGDFHGQIPILDTHIHLFDPNRPQGTPALIPGSSTSITGSFPAGYRQLVKDMGVVGAIHIEASDWVEDNLWALEVCAADDMMVGVIGNLNPEVPEFGRYLERFHRNPLFRGIRYGDIWNYDLVGQSRNGVVLDRLKLLAKANLVMDSASPSIALLEALLRVSDAIPSLRMVIDHLPGFYPTPSQSTSYAHLLAEFRNRPQVFVKLSQIIHRSNGHVSTRLVDYRTQLDLIRDTFGEDRVLFGSDYPNSDSTTSIEQVFQMAREYYANQPKSAAEKFFWKNSLLAYKWRPRTAPQELSTL